MLTSQDVAAVTFPTVRWSVGYEIDEVTEFLGAVRETLSAYEERRPLPEPLTSRQVHTRAFFPTKFREGLGKSEVDRFMNELVVTLREHEGAL